MGPVDGPEGPEVSQPPQKGDVCVNTSANYEKLKEG